MYWINNVKIYEPTALRPGIRRIQRENVCASGKTAIDIKAIKREFSLEYNVIPESILRQLLDLLNSQAFHSLRHPDPQAQTGERTTIVHVGDINMIMWRKIDGVRYWKEVAITLIEQ